ncbi:hypothetical protein SAMN05444172_2408 [Burkholderia sp. GAS332]|nr:hypothetical protein SAMN05444172_2408 [Burkholderia sp. GAS332]
MANSCSRKRRLAAKPRMRLHKQLLLPLPDEYVRQLSLASHLAFVGCRTEEGSSHLLNELSWTTYLSFYLWKAGIGRGGLDAYKRAEIVLDCAVRRAEVTGTWRLDDEEAPAIEEILRLHDEQIAGVPGHVFLDAKSRLQRLLNNKMSMSPVNRAYESQFSTFSDRT